jgi:Polyketide cyclase / dehydrase and lipid transport
VQDQFMENARPVTLLITSADRTVPITVQQRSRLAPADSMALIGPIDLSRVFHPLAPFPGVASVANQTEAWDHPGPSRNPQFSDGSQADEQLIEYTAGSSFAYQLTGFTNILSKLAFGIRGEWTFTPDGEGTLIRWSYEFKPLPGRRWIVAGPFKPLWRRYMMAALARCVEASESDFYSSTTGDQS